MIEIITSDGISLDLSPNAEFSLEMENPIFSSDTVPAAFSTQITLSPTARNCRVFGYMKAMMLPPTVKEVMASVLFNGFPLLSGKLIYEGIEDGNLNYTFTEIANSADLNRKIYEREEIIASTRPVIIEESVKATIDDFIDGHITDAIYAPVMIDQAYTETKDYLTKDVVRKYINYPYPDSGQNRVEMPVFPFIRLLSPIINGPYPLIIIQKLRGFLGSLCLVGQYRLSAKKEIGTVNSGARIDLSKYLPDATYLDLIKVLCGIFCAHLYQDGGKISLRDAKGVLEDSPIIQLDGKVADSFSSGQESGKKYVLGWAGKVDNTYNIDNLELDLADGDVVREQGNLSDIIPATEQRQDVPWWTNEQYGAIYHSGTGQVFSLKRYLWNGDQASRYILDSIYQRHEDYTIGESEETNEVRIQGAPVKTIPINVPHKENTENDTHDNDLPPAEMYRMAPVITIPDKEDRGTDLLIGVYGFDQLSDQGIVIDPDTFQDRPIFSRISLSPSDLFEEYHSRFASWIARNRQTVTVGLDLTPTDIAKWRLFNRFYFQGRMWICKKLTVTFTAGVERMESEGEFVEL